MTVEQINLHTLSKGMTRPNVVYRAKRNVLRHGMYLVKEGDLFCISGCGTLSPNGFSKFKIGDKWEELFNTDVEHYANAILEEAPE